MEVQVTEKNKNGIQVKDIDLPWWLKYHFFFTLQGEKYTLKKIKLCKMH